MPDEASAEPEHPAPGRRKGKAAARPARPAKAATREVAAAARHAAGKSTNHRKR
jgi:hypothetical protein